MNTIANVALGFGLDLTRLEAQANAARQVFQKIQQQISKISLQGAIRGNPFAHQIQAIQEFEKQFNKAMSDLAFKYKPENIGFSSQELFGNFNFKPLMEATEQVGAAMDNLENITKEYQNTLSELNEKKEKGIITEKKYEAAVKKAEEAYNQNMIKAKAAAVLQLADAYKAVYNEAMKLAKSVQYLNDQQKLQVGYVVAQEEITAIQKLVYDQQRYVQSIKLGIDVLQNEKLLRQSIISLALKGKEPERETLKILSDVARKVTEVKAQYETLNQVRKQALKDYTTTGSSASLAMSKESLDQQRSLLQTAIQTRVEYNALSNTEKELYMETQGYGTSLQSLNITIKELEERIAILKAAQSGGVFKNDIEGAKKLALDLEELEQRLLRFKIQMASKQGWTTGVENYKTELASSIETAEKRKITEDAAEYKKQASNISELTSQYERLSRIRDALRKDKSIDAEKAINRIYQEQSEIMKKLTNVKVAFDKTQTEQYAYATYGVKNLEQIRREIKEVELQKQRLTAASSQKLFWQDEASLIRYAEEVNKLEQKLLRLKQTRDNLSGRTTAMTSEELQETQLAERKLLLEESDIQLTKQRHEAEKKIVQTIDMETKYLQNLGVDINNITKEDLKNEVVAKRVLSLYRDMNLAKEKGVKLSLQDEQTYLKIEEAAKKAQAIQNKAAGVFTLDAKRIAWFAQLRAYWAVYQVLADAMQGAINTEQKLANIGAAANATTKEIQNLTAAVVKMGQEFILSPEELTNGLLTIVKAGYSASEALDMMRASAALATSTLEGMEVSAELLTTVTMAWGLSTKESGKVADILKSAANESKLSLTGLVTAFNYVTGVAPELNMSLQEVTAALAQMSNSGLNASIAGTSLRAMLSSLMAPNTRFLQSLQSLGLTFMDINPEIHSFGDILKTLKNAGFDVSKSFEGLERRAATGITIMVEQADMYDSMVEKMYQMGSAEEAARKNLESFQGRWTQFKNTVSASLVQMGGPVSAGLQELLQWATKIMTIVGDVGKAVGNAFGFVTSSLRDTIMEFSNAYIFERFGLSWDFPVDEVKQTTQAMLELQHALKETDNQLNLLLKNYTLFRKTQVLGQYSVSREQRGPSSLGTAQRDIRSLEVAKQLDLINGNLLATYKKQYEEIVKLNQQEGKTRSQNETVVSRLISLNAHLAEEIENVNKKYEREIFLLASIKAAQEQKLETETINVMATKLKSMLDVYEDLHKTIVLSSGDILPPKKVTGEMDNIIKTYKEYQQVISNMDDTKEADYVSKLANRMNMSIPVFKEAMEQVHTLLNTYEETKAKIEAKATKGEKISIGVTISPVWFGSKEENIQKEIIRQSVTKTQELINKETEKVSKEALQKSEKDMQTITRAMIQGITAPQTLPKGVTLGWVTKLFVDNIPTDQRLITPKIKEYMNKVSDAIEAEAVRRGKSFGKVASELFANFPRMIPLFKGMDKKIADDLDAAKAEMEAGMNGLKGVLAHNALGGGDSVEFKKQIDIYTESIKRYRDTISQPGTPPIYWTTLNNQLRETSSLIGSLLKPAGQDSAQAVQLFREVATAAGLVSTRLTDMTSKTYMTDEALAVWLRKVKSSAGTVSDLGDALGLANANQYKLLNSITESFAKSPAGPAGTTVPEQLEVTSTLIEKMKIKSQIEREEEISVNKTVAGMERMINLYKDLIKISDEEVKERKEAIKAFGVQESEILEIMARAEAQSQRGISFDENRKTRLYGKDLKELEKIKSQYNDIRKAEKEQLEIRRKLIELYLVEQRMIEGIENAEEERIRKYKEYKQTEVIELKRIATEEMFATRLAQTRAEEMYQLQEEVKLLERERELASKRREEAEERLRTEKGTYREAEASFKAVTKAMSVESDILRRTDKGAAGLIDEKLKEFKAGAEKYKVLDVQFLQTFYQGIETQLEELSKQKTKLQEELVKVTSGEDKGRSSINQEKSLTLSKKIVQIDKEMTSLSQIKAVYEESTNSALEKTQNLEGEILGLVREQLGLTKELTEKEKERILNSNDWGDRVKAFNMGLDESTNNLYTIAGIAKEIGETIGSIPNMFTDEMASGMTDWGMQTFMGKDTERMEELKNKYRELEEEKEKAIEKLSELEENGIVTVEDAEEVARTTTEIENLNAAMERTADLMEKEKSLITQLAVAWKKFVDIAVEELMRLVAKLFIVKSLSAIGITSTIPVPITPAAHGGFFNSGPLVPITKYATGGVTSGTLLPIKRYATGGITDGALLPLDSLFKRKIPKNIPLDTFAGGGVTSNMTLALVGDNPSKKEIIIPTENIKKDSVSGYVREKEGVTTQDITIVNTISPNDIAAAISQDEGQRVIINTIGNDMLKRGTTYRIFKDVGRKQ